MAGPTTFGYQVLMGGVVPVVPTTKVQVRFYEFSGDGNCTCSLTSTYEIWEDNPMESGGDLSPSVNDVIAGYDQSGATTCAIVTAINQSGTAVGSTSSDYNDCDECNENELICSGGEGGGGEGFYCLLPDMLVKLKTGVLTKVVNLNVGDEIHGPDGYTQITELIKDHPRSEYHIINNELHITGDHPIEFLGETILASIYPGENKYINEETNTVYVGTADPTFYVYCKNNIYTVSGHYKSNK